MQMLTCNDKLSFMQVVLGGRHLLRQLCRKPLIVIVQQCYPFGAGRAHANISRLGAPHLLCERKAMYPGIAQAHDGFGRLISLLSIDDYDHFNFLKILRERASHRAHYKRRPSSGRNHDTDTRPQQRHRFAISSRRLGDSR
jgi:hypothetical protein